VLAEVCCGWMAGSVCLLWCSPTCGFLDVPGYLALSLVADPVIDFAPKINRGCSLRLEETWMIPVQRVTRVAVRAPC
jgi:hypothetical protein